MMIEDGFKYQLRVPTKDFTTWETKDLKINMITKNNHLFFLLTIPQYIFEKVIGTEQKYLKEHTENIGFGAFSKKIRFTNRLKSENFHDLLEQFNKICQDAMQVQDVIDSVRDKVILVKFTQSKSDELDSLNHATKGTKLETKFQYFVCYQRKVKDQFSDHIRIVYESLEQQTYGMNKRVGYGFKHYMDDLDRNFDVLKWTREREEFFKHIQESFVALNEKFSDFFSKLTDEKVEQLMTMHKQQSLLPAAKQEEKSLNSDQKKEPGEKTDD